MGAGVEVGKEKGTQDRLRKGVGKAHPDEKPPGGGTANHDISLEIGNTRMMRGCL